MESRHLGQACRRQVLHGSYWQVPVGMFGAEVLPHQFHQQIPVGPVVVALTLLLGDHVTLGIEVFLGHCEAAKTIRLQPQHHL